MTSGLVLGGIAILFLYLLSGSRNHAYPNRGGGDYWDEYGRPVPRGYANHPEFARSRRMDYQLNRLLAACTFAAILFIGIAVLHDKSPVIDDTSQSPPIHVNTSPSARQMNAQIPSSKKSKVQKTKGTTKKKESLKAKLHRGLK